MKLIKKYYPMFISVLFMFIYSFLLGCVFYDNMDNITNESSFWIIFLIVELLLVIGIWVEIIMFIIHAAKNKDLKHKVIWGIAIYMFNIFIIPYYNIKHVVKEKNITFDIIMYIGLLILSVIFGFTYAI